MNNGLTDFEMAVQSTTVRLLEEFRPVLEDLELVVDYRGIRVIEPSHERRCSELEVVFRRGRNVADVLEFFVERDGVPNATLSEVEQWLRTELSELPSRHK
jgi:hypothetical protein